MADKVLKLYLATLKVQHINQNVVTNERTLAAEKHNKKLFKFSGNADSTNKHPETIEKVPASVGTSAINHSNEVLSINDIIESKVGNVKGHKAAPTDHSLVCIGMILDEINETLIANNKHSLSDLEYNEWLYAISVNFSTFSPILLTSSDQNIYLDELVKLFKIDHNYANSQSMTTNRPTVLSRASFFVGNADTSNNNQQLSEELNVVHENTYHQAIDINLKQDVIIKRAVLEVSSDSIGSQSLDYVSLAKSTSYKDILLGANKISAQVSGKFDQHY